MGRDINMNEMECRIGIGKWGHAGGGDNGDAPLMGMKWNAELARTNGMRN